MQSAMEQSKILMWTRRKSIRQADHPPPVFSFSPPPAASGHGYSWEEQAFAEDSAGCVWPPRSYSCSFCLREFRSAQALGGHMNVHRRDRARLRTSPTSSLEGTQQLSRPDPTCLPSAAHNPRAGHGSASSSPLSSSRVVSVSSSGQKKINSLEQARAFPSNFSAPFVKEYREACPLSTSLLISTDHQFSLRLPIASKLQQRREDLPLVTEMNRKRDAEEEGEDDSGAKRRRVDVATIPFIISSFQGEETTLQSKVAGLPPSPMVEIDLELRL